MSCDGPSYFIGPHIHLYSRESKEDIYCMNDKLVRQDGDGHVFHAALESNIVLHYVYVFRIKHYVCVVLVL